MVLLATFKYLAVVERLRCPISSWILRTSVPVSSRCVAKACLKECGVMGFWIPLRWRAIRQASATADRVIGYRGCRPEKASPWGERRASTVAGSRADAATASRSDPYDFYPDSRGSPCAGYQYRWP